MDDDEEPGGFGKIEGCLALRSCHGYSQGHVVGDDPTHHERLRVSKLMSPLGREGGWVAAKTSRTSRM